MVQDEKGDFVADCHSILATWRKLYSMLLSIHVVNDVRQTEIHTAEPFVSEPSAFEFELAIENLNRHKSPGTGQIPVEMNKESSKTIRSEIHPLIFSIWNKEKLTEEWK